MSSDFHRYSSGQIHKSQNWISYGCNAISDAADKIADDTSFGKYLATGTGIGQGLVDLPNKFPQFVRVLLNSGLRTQFFPFRFRFIQFFWHFVLADLRGYQRAGSGTRTSKAASTMSLCPKPDGVNVQNAWFRKHHTGFAVWGIEAVVGSLFRRTVIMEKPLMRVMVWHEKRKSIGCSQCGWVFEPNAAQQSGAPLRKTFEEHQCKQYPKLGEAVQN